MCQGMAPNFGNNMKYLTSQYLSLMHAFTDHAISRLDNPDNSWMYNIAMLQEYGTLRLDGGRQTGKTEAVAQFAADWLSEGNSVIIIANKCEYARETYDRIKRRWKALESIDKDNGVLMYDTVRSFLSGHPDKFRGISLKRTLFIVEEPIRIPEMYKFYEAWDNLKVCYSANKPGLPLFFVLGIQ